MSKESELEVFRRFLKENGLRYTPEREAIVKEIFSLKDHFDVDRLYSSMKEKGRNVSRASIYRLIPLLIEANLIQEVYSEGGQRLFEHVYGHEHHCHLRCKRCKKVEEFTDPRTKEIEKTLQESFGYQIFNHKMEVTGICPECQRQDQR